MNRMIKRMAVPVGAAIVLGSSGFAFMASNSVPETFNGSGSGTISGYTVYDVHYVLDPSNLKIDGVQFNLNHAADADNIRAAINDGNGSHVYNNCANISGGGSHPAPSGTRWNCDFSGGAGGNAVDYSSNKLIVTASQ